MPDDQESWAAFEELRNNLNYARELVSGGRYLERLQVGAFDVADLRSPITSTTSSGISPSSLPNESRRRSARSATRRSGRTSPSISPPMASMT
jgi:hypothetical protein